jgi:hypothetical protein
MTKVIYFFSAAFCFVVLCNANAYAQEFTHVYLNAQWEITSSDNATYYRESDLDTTLMSYEGAIVDRYHGSNTIEMTGNYSGGKKHGEFSFFHPDGHHDHIQDHFSNRWERRGVF